MAILVRRTTKLDTGVTQESRSPCSILMTVYMFGGSEETARSLLGFGIAIAVLHNMSHRAQEAFVSNSDNLNTDWYSITALAFMVSRLAPIENIWSWITERLAHFSSLANMVHEVWHNFEAAWNELSFLSSKSRSTQCLTG
ncbi:hypothetical protein HNY73_007113 [Argiope bruennichi]|uniref:Uncharacterized protein n=1 Tax=Argiope bruennichi TaxID=94029 RepID=A0A8T0FFZ9_ARGBR|nr:hypothetical protein HNY73_007113 [Argiope bruennichi]